MLPLPESTAEENMSSRQNSIGAKKNRSLEQNRKFRNRLAYTWTTNSQQRCKDNSVD